MIDAMPAPHVLVELQRARELLRDGHHATARKALAALLRSDSALFDAHWLLAGSYMQTGEFARAQKELHTCARLRPRDVNVCVLLGRVLQAGNQAGEAERAWRRALTLDACHADALALLARLLLEQDRAVDARALLEPRVSHGEADTEALLLYGHASMALGQFDDAAGAFRAIVARDPENTDARLRFAAALADNAQGRQAETEARIVIRKRGTSPQAGFVLARALMGQGRFDEAEACLREVVGARPDHLTAQNNLSELVWMRTGDAKAAGAELDSALRARPDLSRPLRTAKARLWIAARQPQHALAVIEEGLAENHDDPSLLKAASGIALQYDGAGALVYAQRAVRVAPDETGALTVFGNALLSVGRAVQALEIAERLCQRDPANGEALAMRADALRMAGDARYRELLDYTHFVRAEPIDVPTGWPSLAAYLADLVRELEAAHTLQVHPVGNSLREGSQVELAPRSAKPAIRAVPQAIDGPIQRYMQALGAGSDPMRRRNAGGYRLSGMWSVRLRPNGFHVNHYHPHGWISSACYLDLPPAVARSGGEGWLKFGEPAFPTTQELGPEYFVKPEPGLLVLFPSYMWHGTVPFSGTEKDTRLTIAFDVLPAGLNES